MAFCPGGGNAHVRKALLMTLPNGDWRDRQRVEIFLPNGSVIQKEQQARVFAESICKVLLYRRLRWKAERNWKEGEEEHADIAILDVCHGLLKPTYLRWNSKLVGHRPLAVPQHAMEGAEAPAILNDGDEDPVILGIGEADIRDHDDDRAGPDDERKKFEAPPPCRAMVEEVAPGARTVGTTILAAMCLMPSATDAQPMVVYCQ